MAEQVISSSSRPAGRRPRAARQDRILVELRAEPSLRTSELALMLGVSHETIRRDLIDLDRRGLLRRTYGGAERPLRFEAPLSERLSMHVEARSAIGEQAAGMLVQGQVVMLSNGSTCWHAAKAIAARGLQITAITNDHAIAEALCNSVAAQIIMLGGRLHPVERYAWGPQAIEELTRYRANWAIIGTSGIDALGVHDIDDHAAGICRRMIRQAERVAILADRSKFDQPALACTARWSEVDLLITDFPPQGALATTLSACGVDVIQSCGLSASLTDPVP